MPIDITNDFEFLSELYAADAPDACFLTQYPSSNSDQTVFQNKTRFQIHDPFPPPARELLQSLGPHHLMCGWGRQIPVVSEVPPPESLLIHWEKVFGLVGRPIWKPFDESDRFIALFPHSSLSPAQQVIDPEVNYALHSKEVISQIECTQADILDDVQPPCIVKLSHGYAGLGNFMILDDSDEKAMQEEVARHWPGATLVINSVIENIAGDYGVQFYLGRDGNVIWLGVTEQHFDQAKRWCGGTYSNHLQAELVEPFAPAVKATADHLHRQGYFGLVGIDILRNGTGTCFLVDVNPRLTGISPFLMASRIFAKYDSLYEGIYRASFRFGGSMEQLFQQVESIEDCRVLVLSAVESDHGKSTICHVSVSSSSQRRNLDVLDSLDTAAAA